MRLDSCCLTAVGECGGFQVRGAACGAMLTGWDDCFGKLARY